MHNQTKFSIVDKKAYGCIPIRMVFSAKFDLMSQDLFCGKEDLNTTVPEEVGAVARFSQQLSIVHCTTNSR